MPLADLQQRFAKAVLSGDATALVPDIAMHQRGSLEARLAIYRNNILGGMTEALAGTFSSTCALVGQPFFRRMAENFVMQHLPDEADLNRYGRNFPDFISDYKPAVQLPYLAEVARFEWAWNEAFLAEDDAPLDPERLTRVEEEAAAGLRFDLRQSARLLQAHYPVDVIHRFCEEGGEGMPPDIRVESHFLLVYRPRHDVLTLRLSAPEYQALRGIEEGHSVREVAAVLHATGEDHFSLESFLTKCFTLNVFRDALVKV